MRRCQRCHDSILVVNVKFLARHECSISLFVAVPSSSFSTTNPEEEAVASQPHFIKSTTGGWKKQEELKRWEQNIETVQPEKFEGEHQIFKELVH